MSSAATFLHLYRGIGSSLIARLLNSQPLKVLLSRDMRRSEGHGTLEGVPVNKLDEEPNALGWRRKYRTLWDGVGGSNYDFTQGESRQKGAMELAHKLPPKKPQA